MTPLSIKTRIRSYSDPGIQHRPAGPQLQEPQPPRLLMERQTKSEPSSPLAQMPASPSRLDNKAFFGDDYEPYLTEEFPSVEHSPELLQPASTDTKGMVMVAQSEGAVSATKSLVSWNFNRCAAAVVFNTDSKEALLMHLDSGSRATWTTDHDGARPASPATPRRGLMGRDRFGYEAFMNKPGAKRVLLVDTEKGYDRREVVQQIVARGAQEMRPLSLELGADPEDALWHIAYRPETDQLVVHLEETLQSTVMHFSGLLTKTEPIKRPDGKGSGPALDIVDGLQAYKARCAKADLNSETRAIVDACFTFVEVRNIDPDLAVEALEKLAGLPGVPMDMLGMSIHPLDKQSRVVGILTELVNQCLDGAETGSAGKGDMKDR